MDDDWPTCDQDGCQGVCVADATSCLTHVGAEERDAKLKQFAKSGRLDARGVTISEALRQAIWVAAPRDANDKPFFCVQFDKATFESVAWFDGATFKEGTSFYGTTFEQGAGFSWGTTFEGPARFFEAKFKDHARFERSIFKSRAWFEEVTFEDLASFNEATFESDASFEKVRFEEAAFGKATFKGTANFNRTQFESFAWFDHATFEGGTAFQHATFKDDANFRNTRVGSVAWFGEATFEGVATFTEVTVEDETKFNNATFKSDAKLNEATFKSCAFDRAKFQGDVPTLGPFSVNETLNLDEVEFSTRVRIQANATTLTCRRGRFFGGVRVDVRRADILLDDSDFSVPSLLVGPSASPMETKEQPRLLSLQRANVAGLVLGNVDLSCCEFAGAHNLDKLRLEADTVFGISPTKGRLGHRQVIAEESAWRTDRRSTRGTVLAGQDSEDPQDRPETLSPGAIAGLYRALRKGREDSKDEPGAADFYYGEMEMRRFAAPTWSVERVLLSAYWAVSGYGLRASRAVVALLVALALGTIGFATVGFAELSRVEYHPATSGAAGQPAVYQQVTVPAGRPGWAAAIDHSIDSATALLRTNQPRPLTATGRGIEVTLRLLGPLLLGLAVLAVRGRVKR